MTQSALLQFDPRDGGYARVNLISNLAQTIDFRITKQFDHSSRNNLEFRKNKILYEFVTLLEYAGGAYESQTLPHSRRFRKQNDAAQPDCIRGYVGFILSEDTDIFNISGKNQNS